VLAAEVSADGFGQKPSRRGSAWRPWTAPAALAGGLVLAAVGGLVVDVPAALLGEVKLSGTSSLPAGLTVADTFVQDAAFVLSVVFFASLGGRTVRAWQLGLRPTPLRRALGAMGVTLLAFLLFSAVWASAVEVSTREKLLEQLGTNESTALLVASAALTCVMAPICEEILFRGYFFVALSNWRGWVPAALLTGLVFGGVHAGSAPVVDLVPLAALGVALCVLYRYTGSLYPCIAAHALNNGWGVGALAGGGGQTPLLMALSMASIAALVLGAKRLGVIGDEPAARLGATGAWPPDGSADGSVGGPADDGGGPPDDLAGPPAVATAP
jgi:membrane protease YdiL (CAAX protease family)